MTKMKLTEAQMTSTRAMASSLSEGLNALGYIASGKMRREDVCGMRLSIEGFVNACRVVKANASTDVGPNVTDSMEFASVVLSALSEENVDMEKLTENAVLALRSMGIEVPVA